MMEASLAAPLGAFAIGLATSLHCVAMCGPLACALRVRPLEYHLGRLLSYSLAGALCGALGQGLVSMIKSPPMRVLPWVLAAILVIVGLGLEKRLPQPRLLAGLLLRIRLHHSLGLLTPLLPCGPLWLLLAAAAASGTWHEGVLVMATFAAGTIPLPLLMLHFAGKLPARFSPTTLQQIQRSLALVSAALLVWRATVSIHGSCH